MADASQQLQDAYQQIEDGNLHEARELLEAIRPQNENNPDFWWVYAHALEDETNGRSALGRVRQLAPNYPGLQEVEQKAGIRVSQVQTLQRLSPQADVVDDDIAFDDFDDTGEDETEGGMSTWLRAAGGLVFLLIIIFGILYVSGFFGGGDTPEETQVAIQPTLEPTEDTASIVTEDMSAEAPTETATEEPTETEEPATTSPEATEEPATATLEPTEVPASDTPEPTTTPGDPFAELYDDLAAFGVPDGGVAIAETDPGNSIVVDTCSNPGPAANANIIGIMDVFAAAELDVPQDVEAIIFNITNCSTNSVSLVLGIEREAVLAYIAGTSSQSELIQAMRRVA